MLIQNKIYFESFFQIIDEKGDYHYMVLFKENNMWYFWDKKAKNKNPDFSSCTDWIDGKSYEKAGTAPAKELIEDIEGYIDLFLKPKYIKRTDLKMVSRSKFGKFTDRLDWNFGQQLA